MFDQALSIITQMNTNKLFIGVSLILMNLGSRYVLGDINKTHEALLQSEVVKKIVLFCICFVGTRDILTACMLVFAFSIVVKGLLNAQSSFNILPKYFIQKTTISKNDYEKAKNIVVQYEQELLTQLGRVEEEHTYVSHIYDNYKNTIVEMKNLKRSL